MRSSRSQFRGRRRGGGGERPPAFCSAFWLSSSRHALWPPPPTSLPPDGGTLHDAFLNAGEGGYGTQFGTWKLIPTYPEADESLPCPRPCFSPKGWDRDRVQSQRATVAAVTDSASVMQTGGVDARIGGGGGAGGKASWYATPASPPIA